MIYLDTWTQQLSELTSADIRAFFARQGGLFFDISNFHVEKKQKGIVADKPLSPLLLMRDQQNGQVGSLLKADGIDATVQNTGLNRVKLSSMFAHEKPGG